MAQRPICLPADSGPKRRRSLHRCIAWDKKHAGLSGLRRTFRGELGAHVLRLGEKLCAIKTEPLVCINEFDAYFGELVTW